MLLRTFMRRLWERPVSRATLATLTVLAVTLWLFLESRASEHLLLEAETTRQADTAVLQFQNFVTSNVDTLEDVGSYVLTVPGEDADRSFAAFVTRLFDGGGDFTSILWRKPGGSVRQVFRASERNLPFRPPPPGWLEAAERKADATRRPVSTPSFNLLSSQKGVIVVVPLVTDGVHRGYIEGTLRLTQGVQKLFDRDVKEFWDIELYDRARQLAYATSPEGRGGAPSAWVVTRHVPVADQAWTLSISPTPLLVSSLRTGAPGRILGIGSVAAVLLAIANYLLTQHQARLAASLRETTRLAADVETTRRHLSDLVNGIDAAVWESDAGMQRFTFVNDYARKLLGIDAADWVSEPAFWLDHVHPNDRDRARANFRPDQVPGETSAEEYRLLAKSGEVVWVREIVTVTGKDGHVTGRRGVVVDITARVQAEEALRQSQKLESLGVLAGGIAHDFNNLLTTILGNTELLKPVVGGRSSPGAEYLERIERTTRRLADLTRQMLAYSGRGRFRVERVDLNATIREMADLLAVSTPKNVQLTYRLDPSLPLMDGAPTQIRQVILNLLTNAAEAIGDNGEGRVILQTDTVKLDADAAGVFAYPGQSLDPGRYLRLRVSDNGCGMSEETISKIFDPFFTTKFTGRGLGLAALRGIVRGHHGGISISSRPGEGTVFTLVFPLGANRAAAAPLLSAPPEPPDLERVGVLVVDDEEGLRTLMKVALEDAGCTVYEAVDGVEGLEQFEAHREMIDVVVLDLTMPRLGGDEVLRRIRARWPETRVILCSGYTEEDIVQRFDGQNLTAFLEKPFKPSELIEKIGVALAETKPFALSAAAAPGNHKKGRKIPAGKA